MGRKGHGRARARFTALHRHAGEIRQTGEPFTLAISMGAVAFNGDQARGLETLLALADARLYDEKRRKQPGMN